MDGYDFGPGGSMESVRRIKRKIPYANVSQKVAKKMPSNELPIRPAICSSDGAPAIRDLNICTAGQLRLSSPRNRHAHAQVCRAVVPTHSKRTVKPSPAATAQETGIGFHTMVKPMVTKIAATTVFTRGSHSAMVREADHEKHSTMQVVWRTCSGIGAEGGI